MKSSLPLLILLTDTHLNKDNIELNRSIFNQAADLAVKLKMKHIYHAGDVFDNRINQSQRTLIAFKLILQDLERKGITLVAIPGNHDKVDYEADESYLSVYSEYSNFILFEKEGWTNENGVAIGMLPYYKESTTYSGRLERLLRLKNFVGSKKILLTHIAANGVRNNDGSLVENGIPENAFEAFDKVFVGHYHNAQDVGKNISYVGSTFPHNFGENNNKGIVIVNEDLTWSLAETTFPKYKKLQFRIGEDSDMDAIQDQVELSQGQDHLRVEIVGNQDEVNAFDKSIFTDMGVGVKKKIHEIETAVSSIETQKVEAYTADSIIQEFDIFAKEQKISKKQLTVGKKYLETLR